MTRSNTLAETLQVDTAAYLRIPRAERIRPVLDIALSSHAYLPRVNDLESDWVAHIAAPAFKLLRQRRGAVASFASIGTGSGLDVLTAVELLGASRVGLTDVHADVVVTAAANVSRNYLHSLTIESGSGDLLAPLRRFGSRYEVIYENLPNVPLASPEEVASERNSSSYVPPRTEELPALIKAQMLDLHYLALLQAREFLEPGGGVLSCLGARVPLEVFLQLGELAGYRPSFLTYGWKIQADPQEVIGGHAVHQRGGFGPFYFYRAETLKKTFSAIQPGESGARALEIERELAPYRLDAEAAYVACRNGERIGHTVAVLLSTL